MWRQGSGRQPSTPGRSPEGAPHACVQGGPQGVGARGFPPSDIGRPPTRNAVKVSLYTCVLRDPLTAIGEILALPWLHVHVPLS